MKINQYCSVCKKHLDMEVIPTDDGGDDGVIWLRCPDCQGFLPKFTGEGMTPPPPADPAPTTSAPAAPEPAAEPRGPVSANDDDGIASGVASESLPPGRLDDDTTDDDDGAGAAPDAKDAPDAATPAEPVAEYAALLAAADTTTARPYRPSSSYEVGDVILHLAYDDVGIVVSKEALPGGRRALKVFFDGAGVVHLIEQATDGH